MELMTAASVRRRGRKPPFDSTTATVPELALIIERIRLDRGWSQRQLAAAISIPEATLNRFINKPHRRPHGLTTHRVRRWLANQPEIA